ncbi:MAG: universal stress protein [Bacteroidetes bacterium]|nr:universal stress protein [Bacteroidota bacterium]
MEKDKKLIIILWDFSEVAENALLHGIKIAKMAHNDLRLLHIINKDVKQDEKEKIRQKLDKVAARILSKHSITISSVILEGSIFSTISKYATDEEANMVILGTHGLKGMQKLTGSWALKVIVGSKVPFIVVRDKPHDQKKIRNIVFPIDFRSENKEKVSMAIYMGKYFDSKVHILKDPVTDKALARKINTNLNFVIKYLIQNNIEYDIHTLEKKGNFAKGTLKFAEKIKADLILIMTTKNINISDYMLGASEQYIIANSSKIPVMCVNPKSHLTKHGFIGV